MDRRVSSTIVEPKTSWPTEFETISTSIQDALGPLALRTDHIGSTFSSRSPRSTAIGSLRRSPGRASSSKASEATINQRYPLLFRDYLRAHPESAAAYATLKRALAAFGIDRGVYADVKDPACDLVFIAAED